LALFLFINPFSAFIITICGRFLKVMLCAPLRGCGNLMPFERVFLSALVLNLFHMHTMASTSIMQQVRRRGLWAFGLLAIGLLLPQSDASAFSDFESDVYDGIHKIHAIDTEHFIIEFSPVIYNSSDDDDDGIPDIVEDIATYSEYSWNAMVEETSFPDPLEQNDQDKVYMILDDRDFYLVPGAVGVTSIFSSGDIYIAVDPVLSDDVLKVTVAHELLHVVQFSYQGYFVGYNQDVNFAEMTAVWAEELVYPDVNDYVGYLSYYFSNADYSVFTGVIPDGSLFEYALGVWPIFLTEYMDDWEVIPEVIQAYFEEDPDIWDAYQAYEAIVEDRGYDLRDVYQDFAIWNYVTAYYDDGDSFPYTTFNAYHYSSEYPLSAESVDSSDWPAMFGTNTLSFEVAESDWGDDIQFSFEKSSDIDLGVTIIPETLDEYLLDDAVTTRFDAGTTLGSITMPIDDDVYWFTALVTPLSEDATEVESEDEAFEVGYEYLYSVELGDLLSGSDVEIETSTDGTLDDSDTDKGGDEAGENSEETISGETDLDELAISELAVTSQTSESVSLRWTRPSGDVAGYYVYYGNETGEYWYYEQIEGGHVTHATIDDLWSDTYYFVVAAYDEAGNEGEYSQEVEAILAIPNYSDVPYAHPNYTGIRFLSYLGVLEGYDDGTFRPSNEINRAELIKILTVGVLGVEPDEEEYADCFPDVTDEWFAPYVCYAKEEGWVQGYPDEMFHPEYTVNKVEALKIILESYQGIVVPELADLSDLPYDDVYSSAWYAPYLEVAYEMGILEETGSSFDPGAGRTRDEVAEEIYRLMVLIFMFEDVYTDELHDEFLEIYGDLFI
jgi:hypothetical protein